MRIILLGAPGSGKGTQAEFICNTYKIPHISVGEILRTLLRESSVLKEEIGKFINTGRLVPDSWMISWVNCRIRKYDCLRGFLLDGFPRTIFQAYGIRKEGIAVDFVLEFFLPDACIVERIIGRRVHLSSGRIYHVKFNPPKINNIDDITGEPLIIRSDDTEECIKNRLHEYHDKSILLSDFYQKESCCNRNMKFFRIDGSKSILHIQKELINILNTR
ncbi:MAG: adenylate kinase [Candidatus Westeberhardia cardiocondylae]|nr:adenylate kinase [Candidatus Westeberhardia cardiocondylae]